MRAEGHSSWRGVVSGAKVTIRPGVIIYVALVERPAGPTQAFLLLVSLCASRRGGRDL
jgi:hypothetical protein